jgi:hypothetical protein
VEAEALVGLVLKAANQNGDENIQDEEGRHKDEDHEKH